MDFQLNDKVALITGASAGIGFSVAKAMLAEGAKVVICGRDNHRLDSAVADLRRQFPNGSIHGQSCDVTHLDDIESLVAFVNNTHGGIDILINNAGTGSEETNMTAPDEKWYYFWDLHVMAAVRLCRMCVPLMKQRPGESVIINTLSICATQPLYYEPIYNVTKAALNMYTKCLAAELTSENIRVNAVSPGLVLTDDWNKTAQALARNEGITPQAYLDRIAHDMASIGRFADPDEIAHAYVFLASRLANYCVGTNFYVDGGAIQTAY